MEEHIKNTVNKLLAIINETDIDWDAFDAILSSVDDINMYDEKEYVSILSLFLNMIGRDDLSVLDIVRHFMEYGYDVTANNGMNGMVALKALCSLDVVIST